MAKNSRAAAQPLSNSDSSEEMVVFALRIKGGGNTLQKGLDALGQAFAAIGVSGTPIPARRLGAAPMGQVQPSLGGEDELEETEDEASIIDAPAPTVSITPKRGPRKYKYNDSLDLSQSEKPWKEFATEKAPNSDNKCYLVAAQWLTENAKQPEFGIGDIFTLFRAMKWNEQTDFSQPLRKMKSASSYFDNPSPKTWKLTKIGLDAAKEVGAEGSAK